MLIMYIFYYLIFYLNISFEFWTGKNVDVNLRTHVSFSFKLLNRLHRNLDLNE